MCPWRSALVAFALSIPACSPSQSKLSALVPMDESGTTNPEPTDSCDGAARRRFDCSGMDPADPPPLGKRVALTFDDGPNPTTTPVIMDILRQYNIPATFFVLGMNVEDSRNWDIIEEMVADPLFDIGNHSWDHADQTSISFSAHKEQVDTTNDLLSTFGVTPIYFRFPYGVSSCATADNIRSRGMHVTGWHIDTGDWCYAAYGNIGECTREDYWRIPEEYATDMLGYTMEQLARYDGGIVLYHDIHEYTANELETTLDAMIDAGYTFVSLNDVASWPNLNGDSPADLPFVGEACRTDNDQCWVVEFDAWCEPTDAGSTNGICTLACEGFCLDRDGAATTFCVTPATGNMGQCTSRSSALNNCCASLPGTTSATMNRFVGESGVSEASYEACVVESWL